MFGLLTGGSGALGKAIQMAAFEQGINLVVPTSAELDLSSHTAVLQWARMAPKYNFIINCAAITNVDECEKEATELVAVKVNAAAAFDMVADFKFDRFIHISTDMVFGRHTKPPRGGWKSDTQLDPVNAYGKTKALGEVLIKDDPRVTIVRVQNLCSSKRGMIARMHELISNGKPVKADLNARVSPTSVNILAREIVKLLRKPSEKVVHLVPATQVSLSELAAAVAGKHEVVIEPWQDHRPAKRNPLSRLHPDIEMGSASLHIAEVLAGIGAGAQ